MLPEAPVGTDLREESIDLPEGVPISDALCNALRELADESGMITADGLCGSAGLDEGVLGALEQRVGPGPWPLVKLEALLGSIFGSGSGGKDHPAGEGLTAAKLADEVPGAADPWCASGKAPPCHWRTRELQQLEDAVDESLRAEGAGSGQVLDEPESEHPAEAEALEFDIARLQEVVRVQIVDPIIQHPSSTEGAVARQMLSTFADDVLAILRKTWHLARVRSQQVQQLTESLAGARAKAQKNQDETEGVGIKVQEMLDSATSRLNAAKRAVKEKDWELADARRKVEQLERDRNSQEQRLRSLETASQRETSARGEAERRLAEAKSEKEAEVTHKTEQEGELRTRLAAAEAALGEVKQELDEAEHRGEDYRLVGERRALELGAELSESRRQVEELRCQLQGAQGGGAAGANGAPGDEARTGRHRRRSEGDSGSGGAGGRERQPRLSLPSRPSLEVVREDAPLGEEQEEAQQQQQQQQQQQRRRKSAQKPSSVGGEAGAVSRVPSLRGLLPLPAGADQAPRTQGSLTRPKSLNSLPMDLRGLGKLLTGGGVTPRR